jgi:hypothetical protein
MTIALCCRVCKRSGELDYERKGWWTDWFGRASNEEKGQEPLTSQAEARCSYRHDSTYQRLERSEVSLLLDPSAWETRKSL